MSFARTVALAVRARGAALCVVALVLASIVIAGCGDGSSPSPAATGSSATVALERAQLVLVSEALRSEQRAVAREVAASRAVWPAIAAGLPKAPSASLRASAASASTAARALQEPRFMREAARLTGPAAGIAGLYESYERLAAHGWELIEEALDTLADGSPANAAYVRANAPFYIDVLYDAHYDLSSIGKRLVSGYRKLGGAAAFGSTLLPASLESLASAYSISAARLTPHPSADQKSPAIGVF